MSRYVRASSSALSSSCSLLASIAAILVKLVLVFILVRDAEHGAAAVCMMVKKVLDI